MSSHETRDAREEAQQTQENQDKENEPSTTTVSIAVGTEDLNNPESGEALETEPIGRIIMPCLRLSYNRDTTH